MKRTASSGTDWQSALMRLPQVLLIGIVRGYRLLLSPWLGSACRFTPTCSVYALDALAQHGALGGSYLTLARLGRCHPWCAGGHDPVPSQWPAPGLFSRWLEKPPQANTCGTDMPAASGTSCTPGHPPTTVSKTLL
jgi:putative membrane protein insertion efficiency factor